MSKIYNMSNRESEIIDLIIEGKTNKEIGDVLFIEISTVKTHVSKIFKKQGVKNRTQLISKLGSF